MSSLHVAAPLLAHLFAAARRCRHVTTLPTPELLLSVHVTLRGQPGRERAADLAARLRVVFVVVGRAQG
uniref:Putative secreted protein n=1 Tax=Ixodes ricinus TaxID=34613 RepID=A0A6B0U0W8_IXORI